MPNKDDLAQTTEVKDAPPDPNIGTGEDKSSATDDEKAPSTDHELGGSEKVMDDSESPKPAGKFKRFFAGYWRKKKWTLPLTLLAIIAIIFVVPATRYPIFALKMKRQFGVIVFDSKTHSEVSGAKVTLDGKMLTTNANGLALFKAKVGKGTLRVSKQYYKSLSENIFVGVVKEQSNSRAVYLVATGRQVPVKVVNKISGKPIAGADIKVLDTEAKTDLDGKATIVLPTTASTQPAAITASGYNDTAGKVQVTSRVVSANIFSMVPSGHVYFLSNLSGNIDVVSTNLDGTGRKTVLAGTGNEDPNNTTLLASTDWKYLALLSKRSGGKDPKLYLINTSNSQTTAIDSSAASFTLDGWDGHDFIYETDMDNVKDWQPGQDVLKSYDADTGKTVTLDQTTAQGSSQDDYVGQSFGYGETDIIGGKIVYVKVWNSGYLASSNALSGKQNQIISINPDGSGKQVLKGTPLSTNPGDYQQINSYVYNPTTIYYQIGDNGNDTYYVYTGGAVTQSNTITTSSYQQDQQNYSTYLQSPSGNQTFWAEQRDGQNTLFVGDASGNNAKQIATLSPYTAYGWYTGGYLLVEKNGSELYIMPASGGGALKVSDYYKPTQTYKGYGGGYGGL